VKNLCTTHLWKRRASIWKENVNHDLTFQINFPKT